MKKVIKIFVLFIMLSLAIYAKTSVAIYGNTSMSVSYVEGALFNTVLQELAKDDPFYREKNTGIDTIKVVEIIPDRNLKDEYTVLFYMNEIGRGHFIFYRKGEYKSPSFLLYADHLEFLPDGRILTQESINNMFEITKHYTLRKGNAKELKQAYYAVDLTSKANSDFDIYLSKKMKSIVDHVEKGEKVKVLLTEFKKKHVYYLLKSELGLTGWIRVEYESMVDETPIKELYYHGD